MTVRQLAIYAIATLGLIGFGVYERTSIPGKSVLLKIIVGLVRPDSGRVQIAPQFLDDERVFPRDFGVIIDRPGYIPHLNGIQNLTSLAKIRGVATPSDVTAAMERVGLDPKLPQKVKNYSLGMKQRLAIAQAFMENQKVLILDEPFNALDEDTVTDMRGLISGLVAQGRTLIMTSHNRDDIQVLCNRALRVRNHGLEAVA